MGRTLMGEAVLWRTDLSLTLFLSPPAAYDGGELALESGSGEIRIKLEALDLVCYPTSQLHRVLPVTRGERPWWPGSRAMCAMSGPARPCGISPKRVS